MRRAKKGVPALRHKRLGGLRHKKGVLAARRGEDSCQDGADTWRPTERERKPCDVGDKKSGLGVYMPFFGEKVLQEREGQESCDVDTQKDDKKSGGYGEFGTTGQGVGQGSSHTQGDKDGRKPHNKGEGAEEVCAGGGGEFSGTCAKGEVSGDEGEDTRGEEAEESAKKSEKGGDLVHSCG